MGQSPRSYVRSRSVGSPFGQHLDAGQPVQPGAPLAAPGREGSPPAESLAGIAWLALALVAGILAGEQWAAGAIRGPSQLGLQLFAIVNGAVAAVGLLVGVLLIAAPSRVVMTISIVLGLFVVVAGVAQPVLGITIAEWWLWATIAALLAAGFSWAGRAHRSPETP
jgi:hypothetical protein